jgi:hypothetical protein
MMEPFKMRFDYGAWKDIRRLRRGEAAVVEDIARAAKADLEGEVLLQWPHEVCISICIIDSTWCV